MSIHFAQRELSRILKVIIPEGSSVVYGPQHAEPLVASLNPSSSQILVLQSNIPMHQTSHVLMLSLTEEITDVYSELSALREQLNPNARVCVVTMSRIWSKFRKRIYRSERGSVTYNWIPPKELVNLFEQSGFEAVQHKFGVVVPFYFPVISRFANRWLSQLPLIRHLSVFNVTTFRPLLRESTSEPSVSIIVAARNEAGNITDLVDRLPIISSKQELIFVEGGSKDATWEVIQEVIAKNSLASEMTIRSFKQSGIGKGDAVRLGFSKAIGDILIILDADISVPPEELRRFVDLIRHDKCEFANGSRLVYPMDRHAMQFLNLIGNRLFGVFFSFLIGQSVRDTLCGTKALWASDYARIADQRGYFGDIDPFGDFDLLFGASRLGLKIRDVPVHYKERVYGSTNISRFRHGFLLIRMTGLSARRLKFI